MAVGKLKVEIELPPTPELAARMFARMDSNEQALTLSLMWRYMQEECGEPFKRAIQCNYVRGMLDSVGCLALQRVEVGAALASADPVCSECGGTGKVQLFTGEVPCGCRNA